MATDHTLVDVMVIRSVHFYCVTYSVHTSCNMDTQTLPDMCAKGYKPLDPSAGKALKKRDGLQLMLQLLLVDLYFRVFQCNDIICTVVHKKLLRVYLLLYVNFFSVVIITLLSFFNTINYSLYDNLHNIFDSY